PWSINDLVDLLVRRANDEQLPDDEFLVAAATNAHGSPREAIRGLADAIVHERDPATLMEQRAVLLDRASDIGRGHGMLMAELLDRGQVSPSDEPLQATLGVTRSRLTQL